MRFIKGLTLMITVLVVLSCDNESSDKATVNDLSDYAKNYFKMRNSNGIAQDGFSSGIRMGDPVNMSFQGLYNNVLSMSGRIAGDSSETPPSDTTIYTDPWISCAQITTTNNNDGSVTTIYDYGDGCEEGWDNYKYWMMGKYAFTYRNIYSNTGSVFKDSYYYQSSSDNYGGRYYYDNDSSIWTSNGSSVYEGESEYDTVQHTYSGNYSSDYDYVYTWNAETYAYKGISKSSYTEKKYVIEQNSSEYSSGSNYYKTEVLAPLVMRYDCSMGIGAKGELMNYVDYIWTYVSGREFIRYKQDDQEGSFEIDYGNGECDNIITIIENGKRVEVDLGQQPVYVW